MSVPLEKLYNFLHKIVNDDIVIYHWSLHGSRNLGDLVCSNANRSWEGLSTEEIVKRAMYDYTTPPVIFHDQEPLNYRYWNKEDFITAFYNSRPPGFKFAQNIDDWLASLHLRCCLFRPNNFFQNTILVHSEKNSKELENYEHNNFIGVYYWCHALIARDWFRCAEHDPELAVDFGNIKYDFLIYNRAWTGTREYRLKFAEMLVNCDLVNNSNVRFNPNDGECNYKNHVFSNSELGLTRQDIESFYQLNTHDSAASADYNATDYAQSAIEVVLETLFDDTRLHLTEKTLRPIATGRPFMLAATPGSLKYLQSYGFQTFAPYINEDYDTCDSPKERLDMITKEMQRISALGAEQKQQLWRELYKIANYNQQLFFSKQWHDAIIEEYQVNMQDALNQTKSNLTTEYYDTTLAAQRTLAISTTQTQEWDRQSSKWINENIKKAV